MIVVEVVSSFILALFAVVVSCALIATILFVNVNINKTFELDLIANRAYFSKAK